MNNLYEVVNVSLNEVVARQDLLSALKTDVRYYLNTVKVAVDHIAASNGHLLCHIKAGNSFNAIPEQLDYQLDYVLIPLETVKDFIKKAARATNNGG